MNPIKSQREWTPREIAELKKLRHEGVAYAEIARQLNRSQKAIGSAVYKFDAQAMRRPWRSTEIAQVKHMAAKGYSDRVIGLTIKRTRTAVSQLRERRGIGAGNPEHNPARVGA